jgi:hypothetical protein
VFKTCHDAAETETDGKTKERRRSGKVNTVAHEVLVRLASLFVLGASWMGLQALFRIVGICANKIIL